MTGVSLALPEAEVKENRADADVGNISDLTQILVDSS